MGENWKRYLAAILLSAALPWSVVNLGSSLQYTPKEEPAASTAPLQTTLPPETEPEAQQSLVPVLMKDGSLHQMLLEEYVRGVVLAEMPAYFETEALKAQAVAARTYALRHVRAGDKHSGMGVCTSSGCCQAWMSDEDYLAKRGTLKDWQKIADAVEETAELVLTYNGKLADSTYFSCSGGRTEDAEAVWGTEVPYLQSVVSPGEEWAAAYSNEQYYTAEEFSGLLGKKLNGRPESWIGEVIRTTGGGVETIAIAGEEFTGVQIRKLLGLSATSFTITADDSGITVVTYGRGHRVGMSQYGADAMAATGCRFDTILEYYYRGAMIDKLSNVK